MVEPHSSGPESTAETNTDVAVIGGGVAGMAAALRLARAGRRVLCIEPVPFPHHEVGESLDWSAPGLLTALGLPPEELLRDGVAVFKRNIEVVTMGRPVFKREPPPRFGAPPLLFEIVTLQVERCAMDQKLHDLAERQGAEFLQDRVVAVETEGDRIGAIVTQGGRRITARWFIDASGRATRLLARKFNLSKTDYGPTKVCLWRHFACAPHNEGTTFYFDSLRDKYLVWIWEIPITPQTTSVGCVMPADYVAEQRKLGRSVREIFAERLGRFDHFQELMATQASAPLHAVSYRSYVYHRASGPNWLIMGEAATLADPLTANGVTAALRHAEEGVQFILKSWKRGQFTYWQKLVYTTNLTQLGRVFNHSIESTVYDWPIRWGMGVPQTITVYTNFSYLANALYSRLRPITPSAAWGFGLLFKLIWLRMESWAAVGRVIYGVRWLCGIITRKPVRP
jgi:flavin-dependent dehydrogenase